MKQNQIKVTAIGTPTVETLSESEREEFYTLLLKRITELVKSDNQ